jgi:hypothetical protein
MHKACLERLMLVIWTSYLRSVVLNTNIRATLKKIEFPTVSPQGGLITNTWEMQRVGMLAPGDSKL